MSASESALRSSAKVESSVMVSSSISRISARCPRTIVTTSSRVTGSWVEWVSAGMGLLSYGIVVTDDGCLHAIDESALDTVDGEPDRVDDRPRARRPVRDHAHAVDAEERAATDGVGVEVVGDALEQEWRDDVGGLLGLRCAERGEHEARGGLERALHRLERDVAREAVRDDDVRMPGHEVTTLDVADEPRLAGEQRMGLLAELVALARLLAVGEQPHG